MDTPKGLAHQFRLIYGVAKTNLAEMTAEHSLAQAAPNGNCANWILGHLTNVQNGVMKLLGETPVWESDQLSRAGWDPITHRANAIDWDTLTSKFLDSEARCIAAIEKLTDASLDEQVPHPFGGTTSRNELLHTLAFHQAYHVGQLGMARRGAGLEGALRGPGQPQATRAGGATR